MKHLLFISLLLYFSTSAFSQPQLPVDSTDLWDNIELEKLIEDATQDNENSTVVEEIVELEENPIDLNSASVEELTRIPAMTSLVASNIVNRRSYKLFEYVDELLTVEGVSSEMFAFIRKYLTVENQSQELEVSGSFLTRTSSEIEKRKGFQTGIYPGSPAKVLNRFRLSIGDRESPLLSIISDVKVGLLTEKDPGEQNLTNLSKGFLAISTPTIMKSLIIGDYQVEASEGLIFWRAYGFSKGSNVITPVRKNGSGIRSNLSSDENSYFRGIAMSLESKNMQCQIMYSKKSINASIDSLGRISSLDKSGLFRTENELKRKNSSRETMIGYNAHLYLFDRLKIGATGYRTNFLHPLILKNKNETTVTGLWMQGMNVSYTGKNYEIFSEVAVDYSRTLAMIVGISYSPINILSLALAARNYPSTFQSLYGNGFGEKGKVQNEKGVYLGIRFRPFRRLCISSYYDQFEYPNTNQSISAPSHGNDFLALAEYSVSKKMELSIRFKQKNTPFIVDEYDTFGRITETDIPREQNNFRFTARYIASSSIRLANKIEWTTIKYADARNQEQGLLLSQSIKWNVWRSMAMHLRLSIFETDSYDSRIYDFEEDLLGAFSNTALYGKGLRWYIMMRYQISEKLHFSAKFAQSIKDGVKSIGTGYDEIIGDSQSKLSAQIEARF